MPGTTVGSELDPDASALAAWVERGDREALQGVFERHGFAALRLALHRLGNQSDADDAVQLAFMGVMRGARNYRPELGSARGYLLAAVLNACAQQRRTEGSRRTREAVAHTPERGPEDPDLRDAVQDALTHLPEHQRQPIELRFLAGLDFPEIATALGRSERTVRGQVTRGLENLRQICSRLGLAATSPGLVFALRALPTPGPSGAAVAQCAALATTGPRASQLPAPLVVLTVTMIASALLPLLFGLSLGRPHHPAPAGVPRISAGTTAAPAMSPPPAAVISETAARERGRPLQCWTIADDATTATMPLAAVGAARDCADPLGPATPWWQLPAQEQTQSWTWGPVPGPEDANRSTWTPGRLLRAPRIGEDAYLVCIAPPMEHGVHRIFYPTSLIETRAGWKLTLDGLRVLPTAFSGQLSAIRSGFVFALGRLTRETSHLEVEVHWREMATCIRLFPESARIERGMALITAAGPTVREAGEAGSLARLTRADAVVPADPECWWQIPLSQRPQLLTAIDAPAEAGGLVEPGEGWAQRALRASGHAPDSHAVYVLGPLLTPDDAMSLQSVTWKGAVVTVTVAVWEHCRRTAPRLRPLLPVLLQPPGGLRDPVTVELNWEHCVDEDASGTFVPQPGRPPFSGTTRLMMTPEAPPTATLGTAPPLSER